MSKTIPAALQTHYDSHVNTTCHLLRIVKNTGDAGSEEVVGLAELDIDVTYDDGNGSVTYESIAGFDPSAIENSADLSVDNADAAILIAADSLGPVTIAEVDAGRLDAAEFILYRVNWKDLTAGRHEVVLFGTIGRARLIQGGIACVIELRGQSQQFKQSIVERDSLTCRARFGSQYPGGSPTNRVSERFPCGFDADSLLVSETVTSVDSTEPNRVFTCSGLGQADDYFVPGICFATSGANAGLAREVEAFSSGQISLRFDFPYAMAVSDTLQIRPDCTKRHDDNQKGCPAYWGAAWVNHFRGEPYIPTGDAAALATPGATLPPRNGGNTEYGEVMQP